MKLSGIGSILSPQVDGLPARPKWSRRLPGPIGKTAPSFPGSLRERPRRASAIKHINSCPDRHLKTGLGKTRTFPEPLGSGPRPGDGFRVYSPGAPGPGPPGPAPSEEIGKAPRNVYNS